MKNPASSDKIYWEESYTIEVSGKVLFKNLDQEEYFDRMEDLALEYYQTGSPCPKEIKTIIERI